MFCLLIKKLVLGSKIIWQGMRKFPCAVWSLRTFPHMNKEEIFFSWKLHIGMAWLFLDNYLFIRPENLKTSLKIGYSRKNPNIYFFENPLDFFIFLLYPWKFQTKQSSTPGYKIMLDPLEIPRPKTKTPGTSTLFFLGYPWKSHFVFN